VDYLLQEFVVRLHVLIMSQQDKSAIVVQERLLRFACIFRTRVPHDGERYFNRCYVPGRRNTICQLLKVQNAHVFAEEISNIKRLYSNGTVRKELYKRTVLLLVIFLKTVGHYRYILIKRAAFDHPIPKHSVHFLPICHFCPGYFCF